MKTMKCKNLGGPASCEYELKAETWEEMGELSKKHAMENMDTHREAMDKMMALMKDPDEMQKWMDEKRKEFDALPDES